MLARGFAVLFVGALALLSAASARAQATPSIASVPRDGITLREYVDVRFASQDESVKAALAAADRAVSKAEAAADKRFDGVNEFRASLNDQTRSLMPRAEAEQAFKGINEKLESLTLRVNAREDRSAGGSAVFAWIVAGVSVLIAIFSLFAKRQAPA